MNDTPEGPSSDEDPWPAPRPALFTATFKRAALERWLNHLPENAIRVQPWTDEDEEDAYEQGSLERTIIESMPAFVYVDGLMGLIWDEARHPHTLLPATWMLRTLMFTSGHSGPQTLLQSFCELLVHTTPPGEFADQDQHVQDNEGLLMHEWLILKARAQTGLDLVAVECCVGRRPAAWVVTEAAQLPPEAEVVPLPKPMMYVRLDFEDLEMPASFGQVRVAYSNPESFQYSPFTDVPAPQGMSVSGRIEERLHDPSFLEASRTLYGEPIGWTGTPIPAELLAVMEPLKDRLIAYLQGCGFTVQPAELEPSDPGVEGWWVQHPTEWGVRSAGALLTSPERTLLHCDARSTTSGDDLATAFNDLRTQLLRQERGRSLN